MPNAAVQMCCNRMEVGQEKKRTREAPVRNNTPGTSSHHNNAVKPVEWNENETPKSLTVVVYL